MKASLSAAWFLNYSNDFSTLSEDVSTHGDYGSTCCVDAYAPVLILHLLTIKRMEENTTTHEQTMHTSTRRLNCKRPFEKLKIGLRRHTKQ